MRILHIIGNTDIGGIAIVVRNYMKYIDKNNYHFDIATSQKRIGEIGIQLKQMGANIYYLPLKSRGIKEHKACLIRILKAGKYDAIHVHSNSTSYVDLYIAKKCGIKCRVAHAHLSRYCETLRELATILIGRKLNYIYATKLIGCGKEAGDWIFGRKAMLSAKGCVLPNAVDTTKYMFDKNIRNRVRTELNITNKYVIGMIIRFKKQKNHSFALRVASILNEESTDYLFVFVGGGDLENKMKRYCNEHGLKENVIFLGPRNDVERLYQAFDVCIMPSLYEGFPVVGVEALCAGLPVLLSDRITKELSFGEHVQYLALEIERWVYKIREKPCNLFREKGLIEANSHGFDIRDSVKTLEKIYSGKVE